VEALAPQDAGGVKDHARASADDQDPFGPAGGWFVHEPVS
jgi:hypothetical protein